MFFKILHVHYKSGVKRAHYCFNDDHLEQKIAEYRRRKSDKIARMFVEDRRNGHTKECA